MKFNKATYEAARNGLGLKESVWIDGKEYAHIPTTPEALLFWALDRIVTPIFGEDGELCDWNCADADTRKKYFILVEETARLHGFMFQGLDKVFEVDSRADFGRPV